MKKGLKTKWGFYLVIVLVFLTGQAVRAGFLCGLTAEGTISYISPKTNEEKSYIEVQTDYGLLVFYAIPVTFLDVYLVNNCKSELLGADVTISYHECSSENPLGEQKLKACSIDLSCNEENISFEFPVRKGQVYRVPQFSQNDSGNGRGGGRGPSN